ncbi:MAG: hypothetical protein AABZ39_19880 [Spirochaetota bacterium]
MQTRKTTQITCEVYKTISSRVVDALKKAGVADVHIQSGRAVVLKETNGIFGIGAGMKLDEEPSELFRCNVAEGSEDAVIKKMIDAADLTVPGRGSVVSENIASTGDPSQPAKGDGHSLATGLSGITCIVQRGQGDTIVRAALDMGFSVPNITFGEGTGLRDKLGLLRITIPAEKDVVHITVAEQDVNEVMNVLIDAGKLDQPGKGFIYNYPVAKGLLNTKILRGKQKHAASIEQMISAIDDVKGNTEWRKRSAGTGTTDKRKFLSDLVNFTLICNEGRASDLVRAAMGVGAAGATISKLRYLRFDGKGSDTSTAREMSDLIISQAQVDTIAKAMEEAGVFDKNTAGVIELKPVPKACTYLGASR